MNLKISSFSKNVVTLVSGTIVSQALPIAIMPILTRLYSPDDFGVFALFFTICTLLSIISTGNYEHAIILVKKEESAYQVVILSLLVAFIISLFLFIIIFLFSDALALFFNNKSIKGWLYFIPIVVLFTGVFNSLRYYSLRKKLYKDISISLILKSLILVLLQLFLSFFSKGAFGLIIGYIFSTIFANVKLFKNVFYKRESIFPSFIKIMYFAKRYKDFFIYSSFSNVLNALSQQIINILIPIFYNMKTLGFYFLTQRVVNLPTSIIGSSLSQVLIQSSMEQIKLNKSIKRLFLNTAIKSFIISFLLFFIIYVFIEYFFVLVFGKNWEVAVLYIKILLPFFSIKFVSSILSAIVIIFEKQKVSLFFNILLVFSTLFIFYFTKGDFILFLKFFSIIMSFLYMSFTVYYYIVVNNHHKSVKNNSLKF